MFPILENCVEGLHLKLADGQEWSLVAEESLRSWLQKFGAILGLELRKNSGLPKIIFCPSTLFAHKGSLLAEGPATGVPRTGWKRHKLGAMHLWMHPRVADVVCEIGPEESDDVDVLRMWSSVDVIHTKAVESGALPLHAGLVVQDGSGVLLAGPGGVGKSTCCRRIPLLWRSPCDDEVLVVDAQGEFRCHPFPTWSD